MIRQIFLFVLSRPTLTSKAFFSSSRPSHTDVVQHAHGIGCMQARSVRDGCSKCPFMTCLLPTYSSPADELTVQHGDAGEAPEDEQVANPEKGYITIFVLAGCPHCKRATALLDELGWEYSSVSLTKYPARRAEMLQLCNRMCVPQIFFNDVHIGGPCELQDVIASMEDKDALYAKILAGPAPKVPALSRPTAQVSDSNMLVKENEDPTICLGGHCLAYRELYSEVVSGVEVKNRRRRLGLRTYKQCFHGHALVTFLMEKFNLPSRQDAVQACDQLLHTRFINSAELVSSKFQDSDHLYRFQCHEGRIWRALNLHRVYSSHEGVSQRPLDLLKRLNDTLLDLLDKHTDSCGLVDLLAVAQDDGFAKFCFAACELQAVDLSALPERERSAFTVNLYNMAVSHAQVALGIPNTMGQRLAFFNGVRYELGGIMYSLNDMENGILRGNRCPPYHLSRPFSHADPRLKIIVPLDCRIHFALNCGAKSCPPVQWYTADGLKEELLCAANWWVEQDENVYIDLHKRVLRLSKLCKWYDHDFGQTRVEVARTILSFATGSKHQDLQQLLGDKFTVKYTKYDWSVHVKHAKSFSEHCYSCMAA